MSERRAKTMKVAGGAEYSKVPDRLKEFWQDNPSGKVETDYEKQDNDLIIFKCWIWRKKEDYMGMLSQVKNLEIARGSADANGTAQSVDVVSKKDKDFEKLETKAIGRALAILGYLSSGEIASLEEMEEYEKYKRSQVEDQVQEAVLALEATTTLDELKTAFVATGMMQMPEIVQVKDRKKAELSTPKKEASE